MMIDYVPFLGLSVGFEWIPGVAVFIDVFCIRILIFFGSENNE